MTDDLKQRLRERQATAGFYSPKPGVIRAVYRDDTLTTEALAYITNLEAKLQRLGRELNLAKYGEPDFAWEIHKNAVAELEARLAAAEAGEDALAECLRRLLKGDSYRAHSEAALAAYDARRKG